MMKCKLCPVKDECEQEKRFAVQNYVPEVKPKVREVLSQFCPLLSLIHEGVQDESNRLMKYLDLKKSYSKKFEEMKAEVMKKD